MSAGLIYNFNDLEDLQRRLNRLSRLKKGEVLDVVGAQVESQTRRRIQDEKEAPSGQSWPAWSSRHATRRSEGHSLLRSGDYLLDSITHRMVDSDSIEVGSNLIYAATHQFGDGDRNIPAREFLGISEANEAELVREIDEYLDKVIRR